MKNLSWAIEHLWLFWLAPVVGALLSGWVYRLLSPEKGELPEIETLQPTAVV
ncbi:MAG: aquaporin [Cyclobacteriaceae bacterium]|nr:aquaporin [Cyclobacteriaceae bacterium]